MPVSFFTVFWGLCYIAANVALARSLMHLANGLCRMWMLRKANDATAADCRWAARKLLESIANGRISAAETAAIAQNVLLMSLMRSSDLETAAAAVAAGADAAFAEPTSGHTLLHVAAGRQDSLQGVAFLLLLGVQPDVHDADGNSPLCSATIYGRAEVVDLLLSLGASPFSCYNTNSALLDRSVCTPVLACAVIFAHSRVVESLLRGFSALWDDCLRRSAAKRPPLRVRWRVPGVPDGPHERAVTRESLCSEVCAAFQHAAQVRFLHLRSSAPSPLICCTAAHVFFP